jgi:hypothetical protein
MDMEGDAPGRLMLKGIAEVNVQPARWFIADDYYITDKAMMSTGEAEVPGGRRTRLLDGAAASAVRTGM